MANIMSFASVRLLSSREVTGAKQQNRINKGGPGWVCLHHRGSRATRDCPINFYAPGGSVVEGDCYILSFPRWT